MGDNLTSTSSEAELLAEYWNNTFLNELRSNLLFEQFGLKSVNPGGSGTLVHWIALADMSAGAAISEGIDPDAYALSAGDQTATLAQYGGTIMMSDFLQDTWLPSSMENIMGRLARHAALTIDRTIRNINFTAGGTAQIGGTAVARNSIATDGSFDADIAEIREAVNSLEKLNSQTFPDGYYVGVVHPDVKYDLQGDTANWRDVVKNVESAFDMVRNGNGKVPGRGGFVGELFGVKYLMTTEALKMTASGSASTDVYQTYIFGPEHYGVSQLRDVQVVIKNPHPASDINLYGTAAWKTTFATKELNSSRMVRLETGASLGT